MVPMQSNDAGQRALLSPNGRDQSALTPSVTGVRTEACLG